MRRLDTAILTAAEAVLEPEVIAFRLYPMVASQAALGDRRAALDAHLATLEAADAPGCCARRGRSAGDDRS
jgi:hypothetical protein